jgi:hypothetical protein
MNQQDRWDDEERFLARVDNLARAFAELAADQPVTVVAAAAELLVADMLDGMTDEACKHHIIATIVDRFQRRLEVSHE